MNKLNNFLFLAAILFFLFLQIFFIRLLINHTYLDKFLIINQNIEKIIDASCCFVDSYINLTKSANCVILKIPSINTQNLFIKDAFDYACIFIHNNNIFFVFQPDILSSRKSKSLFIKNITDANFKYLFNCLEFSCTIDNFEFSANYSINTNYKRLYYSNRIF